MWKGYVKYTVCFMSSSLREYFNSYNGEWNKKRFTSSSQKANCNWLFTHIKDLLALTFWRNFQVFQFLRHFITCLKWSPKCAYITRPLIKIINIILFGIIDNRIDRNISNFVGWTPGIQFSWDQVFSFSILTGTI